MAKRSNARRELPGSVRIIAGEWRGRRVPIVPGTDVRPTPDRVRETLFNWLMHTIAGAKCLDLYAGTGALGFEALSRGAAEAWFVEQDPALVDALAAQAEVFDVRPRIVRQNVESLLRGRPPGRFDVVFLDPPYVEPIEPLLDLLPPWLTPEGVVYVERASDSGLLEVPRAHWWKRGRAGAVEFGLLRYDV
ncbi:MAG TPA: 16S rRNA (guanine(966)-N(2))-methyltransferase RsmD [Gammaproteobacteria bacterium]|nr:16S rRNA (guanine(966)-N(2))-methyltransferase RsmD [Gammaproteobacteria bacterium]